MQQSTASLLKGLYNSDARALARTITVVENELEGYKFLLQQLKIAPVPVIGITGPPGAGKSTLVNQLIRNLSQKNKVGIIAIDPTSPFNYGALLGDRIRMNEHYNNPNVFIRSLATRGSLGGLSEKALEITDVMKAAGFDYIFLETVGVGQSEVEIAGLADTTIVVLVPESGDEVQTMKSGLMEIADIFVVNKSDREKADIFAKNIESLVRSNHSEEWISPVIKTIASKGAGLENLVKRIKEHSHLQNKSGRKTFLLTQKAWHLIREKRMKNLDKQQLFADIEKAIKVNDFNLYDFVEKRES